MSSLATDRHDRRQQAAREGVVGGREQVLGIGRDVVQVPRPADAVLHGLAAHEMGVLERSKLLEDPGPAGAEARRELVRRARAVHPQADEQVAPKAGRATTDEVVGGGGDGVRLGVRRGLGHQRKASIGRRDALSRW